MRMLRSFVAASIALGATSAFAGTFPSPPLYPSFSSAKAQFITIDPPGATQAFAVAINRKGEVAGYYADKKGGYGFIRKANGTFLKFRARKNSGTAVSDMDEDDDVIGTYEVVKGGARLESHAFMRKADGTITRIDAPNSNGRFGGTIPYAINNNGEIAGTFTTKDGVSHGFLRASSGTFTVVNYPGSNCYTYLFGINLAGTAFGRSCAGAFMRDSQGNFTTINPPGSAGSATATAINASGAVAGYFFDNNRIEHGFIRDPSGSFTIVDSPRPHDKNDAAYILGLNRAGGTVGCYNSYRFISTNCFIRSATGVLTKLRVPGAYRMYPASINDRRQIVGYYTKIMDGEPHGFLRTQ
jgi:hypothetical protein